MECYGNDHEHVDLAVQACTRAVQAFAQSYGSDAKPIIVRSTGRVNLLGMHVDHRGGCVNPIAIKELFFVAEPREDDFVVMKDVATGKFPDEKFRIRECLPEQKIEDWDSWCHDEYEKRKDDPSVTWSNYVRAAVLYLQHLRTGDDGTFDPPFRGMNVMVCGNIPRAVGLSTSSAVVVAAAEACIRINDLQIDPRELAEICGYAEWYVGTRGGSGDHAAITLARANSIAHLTSFPVSVTSLPFPQGYKVVLVNSMIEANKREGARDAFNERVASYALGFMVARDSFPQYAAKLEHLRDINPMTLEVDEAEVYRIIKSMPCVAARDEILRLLPGQANEVRQVFRSHTEPSGGYRIRQACVYGISECLRSEMAQERLETGDIEGFGELVSISHDGDRVTKVVDGKRVAVDNGYPDRKIDSLISDLSSGDAARAESARLWRQPGGYNVSVPEIDELVDIAMASTGVVGAGLVGAGLGGSIVAIVQEAHASGLIENLAQGYYRPRNLPIRAEVVVPVQGSGIFDV